MTLKFQLNIILIFIIIILASFIPELYKEFFDWKCNGSGELIVNNDIYHRAYFIHCNYTGNYHNETWHYGFRHYIWWLFGATMLVINIINLNKLYKKML